MICCNSSRSRWVAIELYGLEDIWAFRLMTVCHNVARRILGGKLDISQQGLMCIKVPYSVNF